MDDVNQSLGKVSEMSNSEPAAVDPEELAIPGARGPQVSLTDAPQSTGVSLESTSARIDLYAALATSARLSSLVVVRICHHWSPHDEEDSKAQDADAKLLGGRVGRSCSGEHPRRRGDCRGE